MAAKREVWAVEAKLQSGDWVPISLSYERRECLRHAKTMRQRFARRGWRTVRYVPAKTKEKK